MMYLYNDDDCIYTEEQARTIAEEHIDDWDLVEELQVKYSYDELLKNLPDEIKLEVRDLAVSHYIENNFYEVNEGEKTE